MKEQLFSSVFGMLLINSLGSQEMITYKTSLYKLSLEAICPPIQTVILPHPDPALCQVFVVCMFGQPVAYECVEGFIFDPRLLSCIPGDREQCVNTSEPNWEQICSDASYAFFADPNVCWKFVFCFYGLVNHFTCPLEEIWSQQDGACLAGNRNTCEVLDITKTCQYHSDGVLPHPHDCSRYLECSRGVTTVVDCLHGEVFDHMLGKCVVGNTKTCKPHEDMCDSQADEEIIKHPNECGLFVTCKRGIAEITECPAGEIFNDYVKCCAPGNAHTCHFSPLDAILQEKANGSLISHPNSCNPIKQMCIGRPDGRVYPHPTDCQSFIRCQSSQPSVESCDPGTIFRAATQNCVAGNAKTCSYLDDTCVGRPDGVLMHPQSCELFLRCTMGNTSTFRCPEGEILDPELLVCAAGKAADCTLAPVTTEPPPISMFCQDRPDGFYAHPLLCYQFINCNNRDTMILSCPSNLIWLSDIARCGLGNAETCKRL